MTFNKDDTEVPEDDDFDDDWGVGSQWIPAQCRTYFQQFSPVDWGRWANEWYPQHSVQAWSSWYGRWNMDEWVSWTVRGHR